MMKIRLSLIALLCGLMGYTQPTNLDCASAIQIPMGGPEICIPTTGDNTGANDTIPAEGCLGALGGNVWYQLTVPSTGVAIIETSASDPAGITDTGLSAFTGDCDNLVYIECDDDDGEGVYSLLELSGLTPGSQLYIAVWEYGNNAFGTFNLCAYQPPVCPDIEVETFDADSVSIDYIALTWETLVSGSTYFIEYGETGFAQGSGTVVSGTTGTDGPPVEITGLDIFTFYDFYLHAVCDDDNQTDTIMQTFGTSPGILENDDCANAQNLAVGGPNTCIPYTGFNNGATDSGVAHTCANYLGGDVWFSFVAPSTGEVFIETAANNGFADGGMALYSGSCDDLTVVACDDDSGEGYFSLIEAYDLVAGEVYYVAVWEFGNNVFGAFDICVYAPPTCPSPPQFSFFTDSISSSDVFLQWETVNEGATFFFEYGPDGFTPGTGTITSGIIGTDGPPAQISGLDPNTVYDYYYQASCSPGDSTDYLGPYGFTTLETCQTTSLFELDIDSTGFDFVTISWPMYNEGATFIIEYGAEGFEPGTGNTITGITGADGPPVTLSGLFIGSNYELYFQEACSETDSTAITGPFAFETNSLPPDNDDLCDAAEIIVNDPAALFNNEGATSQEDEPFASCWGGLDNPMTVWMTFTGTATGNATVTTNFSDTELTDTHVTVYELTGDDCTDFSNVTELGCDEDYDVNVQNYLSVVELTGLVEGADYYIQVDGWDEQDGEFLIQVFDGALGLDGTSLGGFELYPNPATEQITISTDELRGLVTIELFDMHGKVALRQQAILEPTEPKILDVSELERGVYMVRLINADGYSVQRVIIE